MILAIVGPTGVGKTKLSIELAKKYNAIIINCDAVQVYKELNIGSAKVTKKEMENVPHFLIDFVSPSDFYTVYNYQKDARELLEKYKDKNIILVGGTGLYLKALLYDYKFEEEKNNNTYDDKTNEELYKLVLEKDSKCDIHPNNRKRLIRFLNREVEQTGKDKLLYDALIIGLTTDRDILYQKINERVDKMFSDGLFEEASNLLDKYTNSAILSNAIGYKEIKSMFNNNDSLEETIDLIKKNSRHYAKRQYTWFNNQMNTNWFLVDYKNFDNTISKVISFVENKKLD